jgi:hypothetical protein
VGRRRIERGYLTEIEAHDKAHKEALVGFVVLSGKAARYTVVMIRNLAGVHRKLEKR